METKQLDYRTILGDSMTREEVLKQIEKDQESYEIFQKLPESRKEELIAFCMGNRGAKVTYDPFFKYVFHHSRQTFNTGLNLDLLQE